MPKVAKEKNVGLHSKKAGSKTSVNEERAGLGKPADPRNRSKPFWVTLKRDGAS